MFGTASPFRSARTFAPPEAEFTVPPLTTVDVPLLAMAGAAIAEVLGVPNTVGSYPTHLVVRRSCGCEPA